MRERDIKKNDKTVHTHERSESQIRREIAAKRAEVEELRRRNKVYEDNKHKLDVSIRIKNAFMGTKKCILIICLCKCFFTR